MMGQAVKQAVTNKSGVAIIITIMMITLLTAVVFELNRRVRVGIDDAAVFKTRANLSAMAASGIDMCKAVLIKDKTETEIDSIQEPWADEVHLAAVVKDFPFDRGELTISISDLLGRIQVNALVQYPGGKQFNEPQKVMWYRLLQMVNMGAEGPETAIEPVSIINAVKDWLDYEDDDAITGLEGAESSYYRDLDPPYTCRNGPVIDVSELVLVKGLSPQLFNMIGELYGVSSWVTTAGMTEAADGTGFTFSGAININTAPVFVLSALLPLEDNYLAVEISDFRQEMSNGNYVHDLSSPTWYRSVHGCSELTIDANLTTTASDIFQIKARAKFEETAVSTTAVVKREKDEETGKWRCRVLKWRS
ncbi:MAG: general secretion pathway protein GspK [Thermodesulfobacteriota bacterium]|nr:general secretion pathway protein GspK [Thermodesulfobacteriota bacterium]